MIFACAVGLDKSKVPVD